MPYNGTTSIFDEDYGLEKKLNHIVDLFGRKTNSKANTPLFYIYKDGTVEKRIVIE